MFGDCVPGTASRGARHRAAEIRRDPPCALAPLRPCPNCSLRPLGRTEEQCSCRLQDRRNEWLRLHPGRPWQSLVYPGRMGPARAFFSERRNTQTLKHCSQPRAESPSGSAHAHTSHVH